MRDRVYNLEQARTDYRPRVRRPPRARAQVLPGDPPWMHQGVRTLRIRQVDGTVVDGFCVGVMARAVGRDVGTVRRLEREGVLPPSMGRVPSASAAGQDRVYSREQILTAHSMARKGGWFDGRPRHHAA